MGTWVREDNGPVITDEVMKLKVSLIGLDLKVGNRISNCEARHFDSKEKNF